MIEGILIGLQTALSFKNLMMVMIGCFAGTIIGMLPGLGPINRINFNGWGLLRCSVWRINFLYFN